MAGGGNGEEENYWPGYVDALTTMTMVLTFIMMVLGVVIFSMSKNIAKEILKEVAEAANIKQDTKSGESVDKLRDKLVQAIKKSEEDRKEAVAAQIKQALTQQNASAAPAETQQETAAKQSASAPATSPQGQTTQPAQMQTGAQAEKREATSPATPATPSEHKELAAVETNEAAAKQGAAAAAASGQGQAAQPGEMQSGAKAQKREKLASSAPTAQSERKELAAAETKQTAAPLSASVPSSSNQNQAAQPPEGKQAGSQAEKFEGAAPAAPATQSERKELAAAETKDPVAKQTPAAAASKGQEQAAVHQIDQSKRIDSDEKVARAESVVKATNAANMLIINFTKRSYLLDEQASNEIKAYLASLTTDPNRKLVIRSFANIASGSFSDARRLAYYRVMFLRQLVTSVGVPPQNLVIKVEDTSNAQEGEQAQLSLGQ